MWGIKGRDDRHQEMLTGDKIIKTYSRIQQCTTYRVNKIKAFNISSLSVMKFVNNLQSFGLPRFIDLSHFLPPRMPLPNSIQRGRPPFRLSDCISHYGGHHSTWRGPLFGQGIKGCHADD